MEIRQLRYFMAVIEHGGFSRAAAHLGRTQQALSKSIRSLEEDLGVRLLDRESDVPRPTAFGAMLVEFARRVAHDESELRRHLKRDIDAGTCIRIGASPTTAARVVRAVSALAVSHPQLRVEVQDGVQSGILAALTRGDIDLALYIRIEPLAADPADLVVETLGHETYRLVAGAQHPLAAKSGAISISDLAKTDWLLGSNAGDVESAWREMFESAGIAPPESRCTTSSVEFCRDLLRAGRHLSILPLGLINHERARGELVALPAERFSWSRPVILGYRRSTPSAAALAVIHALHTTDIRP